MVDRLHPASPGKKPIQPFPAKVVFNGLLDGGRLGGALFDGHEVFKEFLGKVKGCPQEALHA
jgi:hypothetical protein